MPNLAFSDLYTDAARWAQDTSTTGLARAKTAVAEANRQLSYGLMLPRLRPWWRKREDTLTPVAGTNDYSLPTAQGTFIDLHRVWYRTAGQRFDIDLVDDDEWQEQANEDTTQRGTPDIANLHASSGTTKLRFSLTPSDSFIAVLVGGVLRLDGFIEETLTVSSGDSVEPLMPNSRRMGIVWKAVELLAARQGDWKLAQWAKGEGLQYYQMILADHQLRTGDRQAPLRPVESPGDRHDRLRDYGH